MEQSQTGIPLQWRFLGNPPKKVRDFLRETKLTTIRYIDGTTRQYYIDSPITYAQVGTLGWNTMSSVTIGTMVPAIGLEEAGSEQAFAGCTKLEEVIFRGGCSSIEHEAFSNVQTLKSVVFLTDDVKKIGYSAFSVSDGSTSQLSSFDFNRGLEQIGKQAFWNTALVEVYINNPSLYSISDRVFQNTAKLSSVQILTDITYLGPQLFLDSSIRQADIRGLTHMSDGMFKGCSQLSTIQFSDEIQNILSDTFYGCTSITSMPLINTVQSIGSQAFLGSGLREVYINNPNLLSVGDSAFQNCNNLTAVRISTDIQHIGTNLFNGSAVQYADLGGLTKLQNRMFYGCSSLRTAILPDSLQTVSQEAFYNCTSLSAVTIPESVTALGARCFYGCTSLQSMIFLGNEPSFGSEANRHVPGTIYISRYKTWSVSAGQTWHGSPIAYFD